MTVNVIKASDNPPVIEHGGTCFTSFLIPKESMRADTEGSYLEFISEFELAPGTSLEPHRHDTHEFYYILEGEATMQVEGEEAVLTRGDLVHIPRNAVHSIWPTGPSNHFRGLAFAMSYMPPDEVGYEAVTDSNQQS
jgi:quercetin dioxygenase-like cupin family protein